MPKINLGKVVGDKGDPFTFDDFTQDQLDGITPKILKGNVTTLEPDENATIDIRKEGLNNFVDFGIPRGKNGAEIKNISASNVELAENNTLDAPTYDDTVSTYTTLATANEAAEDASNKIKSGTGLLATLSNAKKSLSAIVQGLKILGTNVGAINGITSDINSESTTIAASSKMVHDLNASLSNLSSRNSLPILGTPNFLTDCNDMWPKIRHTAALYHVTTDVANAPLNSHCVILAMTFTSTGYGMQICFSGSGIYRRTMSGANNWNTWVKITN